LDANNEVDFDEYLQSMQKYADSEDDLEDNPEDNPEDDLDDSPEGYPD